MPVYKVKAKKGGKTVTMTITAPGRAEAAQNVQRQGAVPVSIWEDSNKSAGKKANLNINLFGAKKAKPQDICIFCRQLAISVQAGLPLRDALEGIVEEMEANTLRDCLIKVNKDLQAGRRFSESLKSNNKGKLFTPVFTGLIHVAEESGTLGETLEDLADYLESMGKLKREIMGKLSYPIFMIVAFILVNIGATFKLFPMFRENFAMLGNRLPPLTEWVFDFNEKAIVVAPYVIVAIIAVVVGLMVLYTTPAGKLNMDHFFLKLPALGPVFFKMGTARFSRTLAITARGGVSLTDGIEIGAAVVGNKYLETALHKAQARIVNGERFTTSLKETGAFSGLVIRMIDVGEESGSLPLVLDKISEIYNNEVDAVVAKAVALIEPFIICLFAVFVTVMVLALYMPIFSMSGG
jgi:type IV pilus assembly protein PilC